MIGDWLNYHHLLYFWCVVREGGVSKAARKLGLTQSTVSSQLKNLERALDVQLFDRKGRGLVPTPAGKTVFGYAEEIFSLGHELQEVLRNGIEPVPEKLRVGLADVVPKLIAYRILQPVFDLEEPVRIVCTEGKDLDLHAQLAIHEIDVVLSDRPVAPGEAIRAWSHLLGESTVTVFAARDRAVQLEKDFPHCLADEPWLLPTEGTSLRASLDLWFARNGVTPKIAGEFEDRALVKTFGRAGVGVFPAPTAIESEIIDSYGCRPVGRLEEVTERYYAISAERRIKHPAVLAITERARQDTFSDE